jgi:hypothetical protein
MDDVAYGDCPKIYPVVRHHYTKGLLDPQMEHAPHTLGDVPDQGAKVTRHGAPGLRFAFLNALAHHEGDSLQLF